MGTWYFVNLDQWVDVPGVPKKVFLKSKFFAKSNGQGFNHNQIA